MSIGSWISGEITDLEKYIASAATEIKTDLAPVWANIETEFMDAEGVFVSEAYLAAKNVITITWKTAQAANPTDLGAAVAAAFKAALPALESGGITLLESAVMQFITSLI